MRGLIDDLQRNALRAHVEVVVGAQRRMVQQQRDHLADFGGIEWGSSGGHDDDSGDEGGKGTAREAGQTEKQSGWVHGR